MQSARAALAVLLSLASLAAAEKPRYTLHAESGFLAVLDHEIQFGKQGTLFNYVRDGGQDTLAPVQRLSVDRVSGSHIVSFLYQPLELRSETVLRKDLVLDGVSFTAGTALEVLYSFPFYRASWMYDLLDSPDDELAFGLSMQIRNATISFASKDGTRLFRVANIGPVPVIKSRGRLAIGEGGYLGYEADGFYAPISYLNGSDEEVVGAILDASLRAGQAVREDLELFLNLRYLGGGALGTNKDQTAPRDGYTRNWLHFSTLTLGLSWTL